MLPAQNRLRLRHHFANVYARGDRYRGQYLRLRIYDTGNREFTSQIGIVISKKISKSAVIRNRIKRQLRAIFRQLLSQLKQGLQIVVTVSTLEGSPNYGQLRDDLIKLSIKAQVLHGS